MPADPELRKRQIYGLLVVAVLLLLAGLGPILYARPVSAWVVEGLVDPLPLLVVILGPTGSGKTSLSVALGRAVRR